MTNYNRIMQVAHAVPEKIVTNDDLAKVVDTSDEWIFSRTGIKQRRIAQTENTSDLCIKVAQDLLAKSQVSAEQLDFVIVATMTPDYQSPSVACQVQGAIGAVNAFAFDLSAACAGFVYALSTADKLLKAKTNQSYGMVIGGEVLSRVIDWQDRSTCVLFGDAAAGVLLTNQSTYGIIRDQLLADGTRSNSLTSGGNLQNSPFILSKDDSQRCLRMNGRDIFDFATRDVAKSLSEFVGNDLEDIDYFLLHQANARILDKMSKKLHVDRERFLQNMDRYGNTSAASIPLLLSEKVADQTLSLEGKQKVVLSGFGGGLAYGHLLLTL
ncbi:beta-ketoacyl-ACP synthase III [Enterococcus columbae]|uniref:Beta-ketoacyl-[acyl-carrier-protein] synthase III n=1 Tax=Enterococcus columbae DSM 7374 = ATCC 51263 TaxID=1121865 RepID=S0KE05_9ENTE|nr:beta-ketoacyl-ACP synthase III [Enterococcus columbae]EOT42897.1 hypothetical protein OMW_00875 [Enterococcus columbae DSM 7374 = ATCC 51263]EOW87666.1 hypothetical protein I568_00331 [Enterococcus columbae DSM 7374 = ATCC 51263]OJG24675.1 hypothetical protein RR47_GL002269 [Enterococcus columbae DSM 7374 = ATCC 51263]